MDIQKKQEELDVLLKRLETRKKRADLKDVQKRLDDILSKHA